MHFFSLIAMLFCLVLTSRSEDDVFASSDLLTVEELLQRIQLLGTEKESLQMENAEIKKRQIQLEKNIEHLTKKSSYILELGKLEDKYNQLQLETSSRTAMLTDTITRLESELVTEKERSQRALEGQSTAAHNGISVQELKQQINQLEAQLQDTQRHSERSALTITDLEGKVAELRNLLTRLTHERDQLLQDLRSAGGAVTKAQKDVHLMKDRYLTASRRLEEQSVTIRELELHHDKCRELAHQQETALSDLQKSLSPVSVGSDRNSDNNRSSVVRSHSGLLNPLRAFLHRLAGLKSFLLKLLHMKK